MSDIELISFILKGFAAFGLSMMLFALLPRTKARRFLAFFISSFIVFTFAKTPQQQNLGNLQSAANVAQREQLSALMSEEEESDDSEEAEEEAGGLEEVATPNFYLEAPDVSTCSNAVGITMNWDSSIIIGDYMAYITGFANLGEDYSFERRVYPSNGATNHTEYISYSSFPTNTVPSQYFFTGRLEEDFDHDQMPDDWERLYGFDPTIDDAAVDSDNDGLSNLHEYLHGTNPRNPDSDGDGINDGYEVDNGYSPKLRDADRDSNNDGIPDYLATGMEGIGENGYNTKGVPNILVWALGIETLAELDDIPLGKTPATPNPVLRGEDCWPMSRSREYYLDGLFEATVEFGENTETSATSVYGISWPGGTTSITSIEDLEFDSIDCDTDSVFDVTITGAVFRVARTGWYSFKIQADDYAEMLLGTNVVATSAWNDVTQSIDSEEGRILLVEGDSPTVTINIHNNGGPGSFHIDKFGDFTEAVRPTLCVNFEASEIVCRESKGTLPRKPKADEFTRFCVDATGGDLGATLSLGLERDECLKHIVFDSIPDAPIVIPPSGAVHLEGIFRGIHPTGAEAGTSRGIFDGLAKIIGLLREQRTEAELYQEAALAIISPQAADFTTLFMLFNHDMNSTNGDGVNIRYDNEQTNLNPVGEWNANRSVPLPVCYVANSLVTVKAGFDLGEAINTNLVIEADVSGAGFTKFLPVEVEFINGKSFGWYEFTANAPIRADVRRSTLIINWKVKDTDLRASSCVNSCYIILDEPKLPWSNEPDSVNNVWPRALDVACAAAHGRSTKNEALAGITSYLFGGMNLVYDTVNGRPWYWDTDNNCMNLSEYIDDPLFVNCYDQAYAMSTLGRMIGIESEVMKKEPFGLIGKVNLVGVSNCNNPFYNSLETNVCRQVYCTGNDHPVTHHRTGFSNHMYVLYGGKIFDACAGPELGTKSEEEYLSSVIEYSSLPYIPSMPQGSNYEIE